MGSVCDKDSFAPTPCRKTVWSCLDIHCNFTSDLMGEHLPDLRMLDDPCGYIQELCLFLLSWLG